MTVRVVPGLCSYRFTAESLEQFFTSPYTMTTPSDRIGCRLDGPRPTFVEREQPFGAGDNPSNVVDHGYPGGSVQVPNGAEPICLLRIGRQTFGVGGGIDPFPRAVRRRLRCPRPVPHAARPRRRRNTRERRPRRRPSDRKPPRK